VASGGAVSRNFKLTPSNLPPPGEEPSAPVVGKVTDASGAPVAGVTVRAISGTTEAGAAATGPDGTYVIMLPAGTYTLQAVWQGNTALGTVTVTPPALATVNLVLGSSTGPLLTLPAGVSLISLPAQYSGKDAASILGVSSTLKMVTWDSGRYVSYPGSPANTFQPGRGYFIKLDAPVAVKDPGLPVQVDANGYFTVILRQGWNLVGDPFNAAVDLGAVRIGSGNQVLTLSQAAAAGLVRDVVWGLTNTGYVRATQLEPGKGYWMSANQDVRLLIPSPTAGR
jgi:hypothetical protein